jgi:hypothetical protein
LKLCALSRIVENVILRHPVNLKIFLILALLVDEIGQHWQRNLLYIFYYLLVDVLLTPLPPVDVDLTAFDALQDKLRKGIEMFLFLDDVLLFQPPF